MIEPIAWVNRVFSFDQQIGTFPALMERLRGTPARASQLVAGVSEERLASRINGKWSVKEHIGHLVDYHALDRQRLSEFLNHVRVLSPADMSNRATWESNHRQVPMANILERFRAGRHQLVAELDSLGEDEVAITALHPRLQRQMRLLDWAYFVAEHDDHHLATARQMLLLVP